MTKAKFVLVSLFAMNCFGQASAAEMPKKFVSIQTEIESLQAPSSPAFGILDLNPSSIARPVSPKEFKTNLLSSIAQSETTIPGNIALEMSPYWWRSRPNVTFDDLFVKPKFGLNIKQSMSYSIATVTRNASSEAESTDLAIGLRFSVIRGNLSAKSLLLSAQVEEKSKALVSAWNSDECKDAIRTGDVDSKCPSNTSAVAQSAKKSVDALRDSLNRRVGFQLDFASAIAFNIAANDTSERKFKKGGLWLTAAYTPESGSAAGYQFLGIVRYLRERELSTKTNDDSLDTGVRFLWRHGEYPVALSMEYIHRLRDEGKNTERFAGVFEYRISDTLSFTTSIGKNFKDEGAKEDLFVLSGISFNLGKGPQVMFDTEGR